MSRVLSKRNLEDIEGFSSYREESSALREKVLELERAQARLHREKEEAVAELRESLRATTRREAEQQENISILLEEFSDTKRREHELNECIRALRAEKEDAERRLEAHEAQALEGARALQDAQSRGAHAAQERERLEQELHKEAEEAQKLRKDLEELRRIANETDGTFSQKVEELTRRLLAKSNELRDVASAAEAQRTEFAVETQQLRRQLTQHKQEHTECDAALQALRSEHRLQAAQLEDAQKALGEEKQASAARLAGATQLAERAQGDSLRVSEMLREAERKNTVLAEELRKARAESERAVAQAERTRTEMGAQLADLEGKGKRRAAALEAEKDSMQNRVSLLEAETEQLRQEAVAAQSAGAQQRVALEDQTRVLSEQLGTEAAAREEMLQRLLAEKRRAETLSEKMTESLQEKAQELQDERAAQKVTTARLQAELDGLKQIVAAKERKIVQLEAEVEKLHAASEETQQELQNEAARHRLDVEQRERTAAAQIGGLESEKLGLRNEVTQLQLKLDAAREECVELDSSLSVANARSQELEGQLGDLSVRYRESATEQSERLQAIQADLNESREAAAEAADAFASREDELKLLKEELAVAKRATAQHEAAYTGLQAEARSLALSLDKAQEKHTELLRRSKTEFDAELGILTSELSAAKDESAALRKQLQAAKDESNALEARVHGLESDVSKSRALQADALAETERTQRNLQRALNMKETELEELREMCQQNGSEQQERARELSEQLADERERAQRLEEALGELRTQLEVSERQCATHKREHTAALRNEQTARERAQHETAEALSKVKDQLAKSERRALAASAEQAQLRVTLEDERAAKRDSEETLLKQIAQLKREHDEAQLATVENTLQCTRTEKALERSEQQVATLQEANAELRVQLRDSSESYNLATDAAEREAAEHRQVVQIVQSRAELAERELREVMQNQIEFQEKLALLLAERDELRAAAAAREIESATERQEQQARLDSKQKDIEELAKRCSELDTALAEAKSGIVELNTLLRQSFEQAKERTDEFDRHLAALQADVNEKEALAQKKAEKILALEQILTELREQTGALEGELAGSTQATKRLTRLLEEKEAVAADLRASCDLLHAEKEDLLARIRRMNEVHAHVAAARDDALAAQRESSVHVAEMQRRLEANNSEIAAARATSQEEIDEISAQAGALRTALEQSRLQMAQLQNLMKILQTQRDNMQTTVQTLRARLLARTGSDGSELGPVFTEIKKDIDAIAESLRAENNRLRVENSQLDEALSFSIRTAQDVRHSLEQCTSRFLIFSSGEALRQREEVAQRVHECGELGACNATVDALRAALREERERHRQEEERLHNLLASGHRGSLDGSLGADTARATPPEGHGLAEGGARGLSEQLAALGGYTRLLEEFIRTHGLLHEAPRPTTAAAVALARREGAFGGAP